MAKIGIRTCPQAVFALVLLAAICPLPFLAATAGASQAQPSKEKDRGARACKSLGQDGNTSKKHSKRRKGQTEEVQSAPPACVEVPLPSLDVQERMQSIVREKGWNVGDEDASESFWSFTVYLSKDALVADTKPDSAAERVEWHSGKAVVVVNAVELGDGYTRVTVSARFEGYGESDDKFAMQRSGWTLKSSGQLESTLTGALRDRLATSH